MNSTKEKWFDVSKLAGGIQGVKDAIAENQSIPDRWKALLIAEIDEHHETGGGNYVTVDIHYHTEGSTASVSVSIKTETKIL